MAKPRLQRSPQQPVVVHRLETRQRTGQLIGLPAAAQAVKQHRQHQILIEVAAALRHPLLAHHHRRACGTVRAGDTPGTGEEVAQRHAEAELPILFHPGDKLLDAADVIVCVPAAKAVQRRFQHHHFRERDNGHQIIAIGGGQRVLQLL